LSFAASLQRLGLSHVSLSGGEPLLFTGIEHVLSGLWELGLIVTITTNGFNPKALRKGLDLIVHRGATKTRLRVSIDGGPDRHEHLRGPGTYKRAPQARGDIRTTSCWVGVNTVVTNKTLDGIEELCSDLIISNVDHWALITEAPRGNLAGSLTAHSEIFAAIESVEKIARLSGFVNPIEKWNYLTAPHIYLLIEPDDRIVVPGTAEDDDIPLGNAAAPNLLVISAKLKDLSSGDGPTFFQWDYRPYFQ
jgi:MoaA/NifB/PqqE/SkfB family radical SAM enzyme